MSQLLSGAPAATTTGGPPPMFKQYCLGCHGKAAMAGVSLDKISAPGRMGEHFRDWERVAMALEQKRMPPAKMPQPSEEERKQSVAWVRSSLHEAALKNAGDPGRVTVRRLTSAEYGYALRDLSGLDVKFSVDAASDSVGGEGFTNYGDVQFVQEANLERYLETAKHVANHAVIGSGPLEFYGDPGKSGMELSAVNRIQEIYRANGFRAVAGEGGRPYGLSLYAKAFYATWRYQNRAALGQPNVTLEDVAAAEKLNPRFVQHMWRVLHEDGLSYPSTEVVSRWKALPVSSGPGTNEKAAEAACGELQKFVTNWPRWLFSAGEQAEGGLGDERALLITPEAIEAQSTLSLKAPVRSRGQQKMARVYLSVVSVNPAVTEKAVIVWRNSKVRVLGKDRALGAEFPLREAVNDETRQRVKFGESPDGRQLGPNDFAMAGETTMYFDVPTPEGAFGVSLQLQGEMDTKDLSGAVFRCTVSDRPEPAKGSPIWGLLAAPASPGYAAWKAGVMGFASRFPQNSQGEPAPSDKDPIPAAFNNVYNQPERDHFHYKLKYYRSDRFLVDNLLDDASRVRLDHAWNDLLSSFEYHDIFLRFLGDKYKFAVGKKGIADFGTAQIAALPAAAKPYVQALRANYDQIQQAQKAARPGHVNDCLRLAAEAWRRPLTGREKDTLRTFYAKVGQGTEFDHTKAIRSTLARILVAPAFLYRVELPAESRAAKQLDSWELASRLSFFFWSSGPDAELRRAAAAGELNDTEKLQRQVKRMLADPKSRRLSAELFGQWLGFYRFDEYRGVDTGRYPEFTQEVKAAMYEEAVSLFDYIVRQERPIREVFTADYTFLNQPLAKHYGIKREIASKTELQKVDGAKEFQRGGVLRLGAVLTATSAPLRTSPVKRGDWLLRRILGTPVPPPPADAGSIPADDKAFGGMSVRERLTAHQRNPSCAGCHTRIDPLGFPLERYDAVGRFRDQYPDGRKIEDSTALANNTPIEGVEGLLKYLQTEEPQVLRTLSQKLLGYALGRTVLISDQPLIEKMTQPGGDATFTQLATEIVTSRQFRYRREPDPAAPTPAPTRSSIGKTISEKEGGE